MKRALSPKNLWDNAPPWVRASAGRLLGLLPMSYILGRAFRENVAFVRESEHWPAERIRAYQLAALRGILQLAAEKTTYYRDVFKSIGFDPRDLEDLEDIRKLPLIDKNTLRDHGEAMLTCSASDPHVDYMSTGGTSGEPLQFHIGRNRSAIEYAYLTASWERAGYEPGMVFAVLRGRIVEPDRRGLRHEYDPLLRCHYYSNFHMTDENMSRYLDHIRDIGPCMLHVYPSSVTALARFVRRSGHPAPANIHGILAESENVYPDQRAMAEEVFGCRYFSSYGHTEKLIAAAECEHSTDYHVWPTYGLFELIDDSGQPVTTPGQRGEIVGTGFINTVMPFIRYRTGDYATYVADHCSACGRRHPLIRDLRGHRTQEVLVAADGSEISWTALNMHDDTLSRAARFQFVQNTPGRAALRVVPAPGFDDAARERILEGLGRKLDGRVSVSIEVVEDIPLTGRGKAVYVDQRIPASQRKGAE